MVWTTEGFKEGFDRFVNNINLLIAGKAFLERATQNEGAGKHHSWSVFRDSWIRKVIACIRDPDQFVLQKSQDQAAFADKINK